VAAVGWREFSQHLIHHLPDTQDRPLRKEFESPRVCRLVFLFLLLGGRSRCFHDGEFRVVQFPVVVGVESLQSGLTSVESLLDFSLLGILKNAVLIHVKLRATIPSRTRFRRFLFVLRLKGIRRDEDRSGNEEWGKYFHRGYLVGRFCRTQLKTATP